MPARLSVFIASLLLLVPAGVKASGDPRTDLCCFTNTLENSPVTAGPLSRLQHRIASVNLNRTAFADVIQIIESGAGVHFTPEWAALGEAGLKPETPITIQGNNLAYTDYLNAIAVQTRTLLILDFRQSDSTLALTTAKAYAPQMFAQPSAEPSLYRSLVPAPRSRTTAPVSAHSAARDAGLPPSDPFDTPIDRETRRNLNLDVKELHFDNLPLGKALNALHASTPISFYVNWRRLEGAGISRDTPVTAHLVHVPVASVITVLLNQLADAALHYTIDGGVVTISTNDDLMSPQYQFVRIFDIRDFLRPPPPNGSSEDAVRNLVQTIQSTVAPETWKENGGTIGSLRELNGQLIVNQTADNQRAIYKLLNQLRTQGKLPLPRPAKK